MFERYRQDARRAIFFSRWEAQQSGSAYIEPEHLLLSLTRDADSKANQLFALSSHTDNFRSQLKSHPPAKTSKSIDLPLSIPANASWPMPRKKQIGWQASRLARNIYSWACCGKTNQTYRKRSLQWGSVCTRLGIGSGKHRVFQSLMTSRTIKRLLLDRCDRSPLSSF